MTLSRRRTMALMGALLGTTVSLVSGTGMMAASSSPPAPEEPAMHLGDVACISAEIPEGTATVCANRDRFGVDWELSVIDTLDDGRGTHASIALDVVDASDPTAALRNDLGPDTTTRSSGSFRPRFGSAIGNIDLAVCVDIRFLPDRCHTVTEPVPQIASKASSEHAARLDELVFEMPLHTFVETSRSGDRTGVDQDFDWSSDGCSGGPVAPVFAEILDQACLRHDFAYRNFGQLGYHASDDIRRRVDEQLAVDAETLGQGNLASGLTWGLQRFAAPVFFGDELQDVWGVPRFLASWLRTAPNDSSAE